MALVHPDAPNTTAPVYAGSYDDQLDNVDDEGCVEAPEDPGLGVSYDWDYIEANATSSVHVYE